MNCTYDPADGIAFWEAVSHLPGYPEGVHQPIYPILFESGALFRISEALRSVGADSSVLVVMDSTPMQRGSEALKPLILKELAAAGWKAETLTLQPDSSG